MKPCTKTKSNVSVLILFLSSFVSIFSNDAVEVGQSKIDDQEVDLKKAFDCDDDFCGPLKVACLCAKKIKSKKIEAACAEIDKLKSDNICSDTINTNSVCTQNLNVTNKVCLSELSTPTICTSSITTNSVDSNSLCTTSLNALSGCVQNLSVKSLGVDTITTNSLCIPGTLKVNNLLNCGQIRGTAVYSSVTNYTLGTLLNFNNILDDPNHNFTTSPTVYHVPYSGYYVVMIQIDQSNLVPTAAFGAILGVPVANPQIYINGVLTRQCFSSYLTFFNQQRTTMTALMSLKAGDQLTAIFQVLAVNQTTGFTEIAGTVDIEGNNSEENSSVLKVHLLSVDCLDLPCAPAVTCSPCTPQQCTPCMPLGCNLPCTPCLPTGFCSPCVSGVSV